MEVEVVEDVERIMQDDDVEPFQVQEGASRQSERIEIVDLVARILAKGLNMIARRIRHLRSEIREEEDGKRSSHETLRESTGLARKLPWGAGPGTISRYRITISARR